MSPRIIVAAALGLAALLLPTAAAAQASASPFTGAQRFDAMGRVTGTISPDPDGPTNPLPHRATRNTYDAAGRLTKVETGTLSAWQSDAIAPANWTGFTVHRTLVTRYDAMSRKLREVLSSGTTVHSVTDYSYDNVGRLACTAVRMNPATFPPADGSGTVPNACTQGTAGAYGPDRIVRNVYDAAGQRLQVREGVGTAIEAAEATWAYNLNGQVTTIVDGNGNRAEFRYDGHGRQTRWVFPSPTEPANFDASTPATALATAGAVNETDYEQYGYDHNENITSLKLRDGNSIAFGYDNLNRMTVKDLPGTEPTVTYAYNLLGAQTSATQGAQSVTNSYDGLGRVSSETSYMGTKYHEYDQAGRRSRLTYPQGFAVGYDYLDTGQITRIRENPTGANVEIVTLGYDTLGRRTSIGRANGASTGYAYDGAGRLQSLTHDLAGTEGDVTFGFQYNPASQITRRTGSNSAYSYTELANMHRLDEHNGLNQITLHGMTGITHDLRGNITNDAARTFTYDSQNRLIHSGGPDNLWLNYDPLGRILSIIPGGGTHEYPDHDGNRMIAEHNGSGAVLRRYVHGPGVDEPLIWYEGSTTADRRYHHADERGSIIAISGSTGAALAINRYDEYGIPQGTHTGRFGYTGQAWIERAGIWHYKARMYHPRLGRFMQVDPIGYEGGANLYTYVGNDPVNSRDPLGLCDPATDPDCIHDPGTAREAPDLPTTETGLETDEIIVEGLRERAENADDHGSLDELPIVIVGDRIRRLRRGRHYRIQTRRCSSGAADYVITKTTVFRSAYAGATAMGHIHRPDRDPGPGMDDADSLTRGVVQYMGWGEGDEFGAGKVEFRAGYGYTYRGLTDNQPPEDEIRQRLGAMNRGGGRGSQAVTSRGRGLSCR